MPTLDSQVEAIVTSPSGAPHTVRGQANPVGYFFEPTDDFTVTEPGVWTVDVTPWHDGAIGTGDLVNRNPADPFDPVLPCPLGDVLGSESGRYYFYVVGSGSDQFALTYPIPGTIHYGTEVAPITISGLVPAGLSGVTVDYTITMPGFILEYRQAVISGGMWSFVFDPVALHAEFPNLDLNRRDDWQPGLSDTFYISLLLEGTSILESGAPVVLGTTMLIHDQEIIVNGVATEFRFHLPTMPR